MSVENKEIELQIAGVGIIFHSPDSALHISEGEDYLTSSYTSEEDIQKHIQAGSIVGFGTSSPGTFLLRFHDGYPTNDALRKAEFKLRLGLQCRGGLACFRDLFELLDWQADCPREQCLDLADGYYHVTLQSDRPSSGRIGDNQIIEFYLHPLESFPRLSKQGVPTLC